MLFFHLFEIHISKRVHKANEYGYDEDEEVGAVTYNLFVHRLSLFSDQI